MGAKVPGSALKPNSSNARGAQAEYLHAAQEKEDLYGDLTGLIVRGVKHSGGETEFDCIQTGRNGSECLLLHRGYNREFTDTTRQLCISNWPWVLATAARMINSPIALSWTLIVTATF
jgi:hypothetical protein